MKGLFLALGAYILWGLFPIYWKWLSHVSPLQVIGHRIIWSFLLLLGTLLTTRRLTTFRRTALNWRTFWAYLVAAVLIGSNWLVYVWAVNTKLILEASLGYFINPLISVSLGVMILRERLRPLQWLPILLAVSGVIYLSIVYGRLPWVALFLAISFSIYGLVKKLSPLDALFGLTFETGILFTPALLYLISLFATGEGAFFHEDFITHLLLFGAGGITSLTLLMFSSAAKKLPLSLLGIMEYIAPTLAFLLGVLVYKEPFDSARLVGFGIVWIALLLFTLEGIWAHRSENKLIGATFVPRMRKY
jgi:chloramphenicol-sensitive protein RarD